MGITEDSPATRLLVVEDDDRIARALVTALQRFGFDVRRVATAAEATAAELADLVLLDLRLPDGDGIAVCQQLRRRSPELPIIMVTARNSSVEKVQGLREGADDYVTKPFAIAELVARIEAVLRRSHPVPAVDESPMLEVHGVRLDVAARTVTVDGDEVTLTRKEFDLLALLLRRLGVAVSRPEILELVWNTTWEGSSRTVDVHVAQLRQKLDRPSLIETVHGVGYRARPPS